MNTKPDKSPRKHLVHKCSVFSTGLRLTQTVLSNQVVQGSM